MKENAKVERILDVAQFIFKEYKKISGAAIDEMKLHKLLYFAQRESFAILNEPLFDGIFQGWKYGPVSPVVRFNFSDEGIFGANDNVSEEAAYILKNVIQEYGQISSWRLSDIAHQETSWLNARKGLGKDENGRRTLSLDDIRKDAEKVRPYDHVWDMYYDEFEDVTEGDN